MANVSGWCEVRRGAGVVRVPDGEKIRELREDAMLDQSELAVEAGVDRKTILDLEHNRRPNAHRKTIRAIAKALGVGPQEMMKEAGPLGPQAEQPGLLARRGSARAGGEAQV